MGDSLFYSMIQNNNAIWAAYKLEAKKKKASKFPAMPEGCAKHHLRKTYVKETFRRDTDAGAKQNKKLAV